MWRRGYGLMSSESVEVYEGICEEGPKEEHYSGQYGS